jgi:hypothetical protein
LNESLEFENKDEKFYRLIESVGDGIINNLMK